MITDDAPRFFSARGTVGEWIDRDLSFRAHAHFTRVRYEVQLADNAARRAEHPDWNDRMTEGYPPPSPDMPSVWEPEALAHEVRVLPPERSTTYSTRPYQGGMVPGGLRVVTPSFTTFRFALRVGDGLTEQVVRPTKLHDRDDLDAYCYGPHDREALALLQPRCFVHGREPIWDTPAATAVVGRSAELMRYRRTIPLDDPRILGDGFNPTVFEEAVETEVIVDRERGVVLEWRALTDGVPYERHAFTDIAFDEPMDPAEFDDGVRVWL